MLTNSRGIAFILALAISAMVAAFLSLLESTNATILLVAGGISFSVTYLLTNITLEFLVFREIGNVYTLLEKIQKKDFSEIIAMAKALPAPEEIETGNIIGGFAHNQVFALADKIVEAVKSGAIKKFFVMAGCDGRMKSRDYYTQFAEKLPNDTVILTAGCAKYRYNKLPLGDINGIPRVLDAGQCNDSYSLAVIAMKLKEIFELEDINDLPLVYNIAWYEQKAVIVLLALLYLGVKNIHLGPSLPGFLSANVANVLVEKFGIAGIGTVDDDIELFI